MISRRKFLGNSLLATAALPALLSRPSQLSRPHNAYVDQIGLQLYTVRNQMAKDPAGTLKAVQAAGYKQVEAGDVRLLADLMPMIQDAGLTCESTFFPGAFLTERWDLVEASGGQRPPAGYTADSLIEDAVKNDIKYLVFGYLRQEERQTLDDFKRIAEKLNQMGEKCNLADIHLCYHNHSFEFKPIDGTVPFDLYVKAFDPDKVHFELDVFWVSVGGRNPAELIEKLSGRVKLLHLKDKKKRTPVIYDEGKVMKKAFRELGAGVVDIPEILRVAEKTSVAACFVEQDQSADPIASIHQSVAYLHQIEEEL